ncbi:hypothetical protein [Roseivivax sp. CAU 1761]
MAKSLLLGVVIWCDDADGRAVIWCDDHGDLAYLGASPPLCGTRPTLAPGDLVRFQLREERAPRRVIDPELVEPAGFPDLPARLARVRPAPAGTRRSA